MEYRLDGWENTVTGFGTDADKTTYSAFFFPNWLEDSQLDALYHGDDIAATLVDIIPEECLRKGFELDLDGADPEPIIERLEELGAVAKFLEGDIWGRLYGGAALVLGADDGAPANKPLNTTRIRTLDWITCIDKRYLSPSSFYKDGPKAGEPETYLLHRPGSFSGLMQSFEIHESRMILFKGARTSYTTRMARAYWDISTLQRAYDVMRSFATGFKSVEVLLTDGPQGVFKIKGLANLLASGGKATLEARVAAINLMRSTVRAVCVDADGETFERQAFTFAGIPDTLDKLMLRLAAAVRIPVTILMGQSPAGMNATGESDFRWFYNSIERRQKTYVGPRLRRLVQVLCASKDGPTNGVVPAKIAVTFPNLWTPTPTEQAITDKAEADTAAVYIGADVLTPEEVALSPSFPEKYEIDREMRQLSLQEKKDNPMPAPGAVPPPDPNAKPPGPPARTDAIDYMAEIKDPAKKEWLAHAMKDRRWAEVNNPASFVTDEALWEKAKRAAEHAGADNIYAFATWWYEKHS